MPKQKPVRYANGPLGIETYDPIGKGSDPRNQGPDEDFMGEYTGVENPIVWKRPPVGKEHGGK